MIWGRVIGATTVCCLAGGIIAWASRAWQDWYLSGEMGQWIAKAERTFLGKAIIVGLSVGLALTLSSTLASGPSR